MDQDYLIDYVVGLRAGVSHRALGARDAARGVSTERNQVEGRIGLPSRRRNRMTLSRRDVLLGLASGVMAALGLLGSSAAEAGVHQARRDLVAAVAVASNPLQLDLVEV